MINRDRNISNLFFLILTAVLSSLPFLPREILTAFFGQVPGSYVASELLILLPALVFAVIWYVAESAYSAANPQYEQTDIFDRLMIRSVRPSTLLMTIPFSLCLFPVVTFFNAISLFFVDNVIVEDNADLLEMSPLMAFFLIAAVPAFFEEFAFRGLVYGGYRRHCRPLGAFVISGLIFGLMHGNFNQFSYTFILGIILAMLAEASGSIWPPILTHFLINSKLVITYFTIKYTDPEAIDEFISTEDAVTTNELFMVLLIYGLLSIVTLMMAGAMISWIAQNEGMADPFKVIKNNKKFCISRTSVWSLSLVVGVALSATYIVANELLTYLTGY